MDYLGVHTAAPGATPPRKAPVANRLQRAEFPSVPFFKPNGNAGSPV